MFLVLFAILILVLILKLTSNWNYWKNQGVVQVRGVSLKFLLDKKSLGEIHKEVYDAYPNEPVVGTFQGSIPAAVIRDIKNVQAVLAGDFRSFYKRGGIINDTDFLNKNLFNTDEYPKWKILRQNMTTIVTNVKLKYMFESLNKCSRHFVQVLEDDPKVSENIFDHFYSFSTDTTASGLFGFDAQAYDKNSMFLDAALHGLEPGYFQTSRFFIANLVPDFFKFIDLQYSHKYNEFFSKFTKGFMKSRQEDVRNDYTDIFVKLHKAGVVHDRHLSLQTNVTSDLVASQIFFSFQAGGEVSSIAMNFALLALSNEKEVLEKAHKEIDEVFDNCDENFKFEDSLKLEYLEMVVNEVFRLYPPIGSIQRRCTQDTVLPVGNVKIKKGTIAVIPIFAIHRDEKIYPDPEEFRPERFSPNVEKPAKFSYLPFGEGNRICVGERFVRLQVKVGLAWILRRFTLEGTGFKPTTYDHNFLTLRISQAPYKLIKREILTK